MRKLATQLAAMEGLHPALRYLCYWSAFNNVYVAVADRLGVGARFRVNSDGKIRTRMVGSVQIPDVRTPKERELLMLVLKYFSNDLKATLIAADSTAYFVYRTPRWQGTSVETDGAGQRLNGVLNVGYTITAANPVWAPIDTELFEAWQGKREEASTDVLAGQILQILYTIRNNTFHGGKRADDANDAEVLRQATPLLATIVDAFLR